MLDSHEPHDFATDEIDQREREMVAAMAPPRPETPEIYCGHLVWTPSISPLDANDDDERMTSHGYVVRTSTERINDIETRIGRIEEMLRSWTGGR